MITLQELCEGLNEELQANGIEDYCPNGLQVEGKKEIKRVATAVTASLATIEEAVKSGSDALIVHHGLFWNRDPYPIVGTKAKKIALLLEHGVSLLGYHLPLDGHRLLGNSWRAALEMGWQELEPVFVDRAVVGVSGRFPSCSVEAFQEGVERYYDHDAHAVIGKKGPVSTGMIISGGGYRFLDRGVKAEVDCFITGNFDEPAWHQAIEEEINFFAMGHSATERIGPRALASYIEEKWGIPTTFLDVYNRF